MTVLVAPSAAPLEKLLLARRGMHRKGTEAKIDRAHGKEVTPGKEGTPESAGRRIKINGNGAAVEHAGAA